MTDYSIMKADEYAQRQGEMDEFDNQVEHVAGELMSELPSWPVSYTHLTLPTILLV